MSLINEMLQDLDAREKFSESGPVAFDGDAQLPPVNSDRRRLVQVLLGLVFTAAVVVFLVQNLTTEFGSSRPPVSKDLTQPVLAATANELKPESRVVGYGLAVTEDNTVKTEIAEATDNNTVAKMNLETAGEKPRKDIKIDELLFEAEVALAHNRLSLPRGESAYDLYRNVIAIDAENFQALSGLNQVKIQYIELIANALEEKKLQRAEKLVNRVENLFLGFTPSELSVYRDQIQAQRQLMADAPAKPEAIQSITDEEPKSDPYLAINKTTVSRELALAQEAQQLLAQGRGMEAARQLEDFIAGNVTTNLSRILLFDYYLGQTQISEARALMEPIQAMAASTRVYMQARLAMMSSGTLSSGTLSSGNRAAIAMLEREKPEPGSVEIYNALLAGLFQKEKAHGKAATLYASLIETNPANVTYWLGMGVSRDALGEHQSALSAYNIVMTHKNLDENVRSFVKARIQALSSRDLAEAGVAW